jgi:signal peptidase I
MSSQPLDGHGADPLAPLGSSELPVLLSQSNLDPDVPRAAVAAPPAPQSAWLRSILWSIGALLHRLRSPLLLLSVLLLLRAVVIEPYNVPTGSMAPVLAGVHKATDCPRCGYHVLVGRREEKGKSAGERHYSAACCPNCGHQELGLDAVPECAGDHLLVDKNVFDLRPPHRWEMAVFRCPHDPARSYVKRVVGLPGELVQIRDGDLYIDRSLARKTLAELRALRVPVFDNNHQPKPEGWRRRWVVDPPDGPVFLEGTAVRLDATKIKGRYQMVAYHNYLLDDEQSPTNPSPPPREQPVTDIYGYNGGDAHIRHEFVHDFMIECDVEVVRGAGWVAFYLNDGLDWMRAELRVSPAPHGTYGTCLSDTESPTRTAPSVYLAPGKTYHVEFAFVDRRATLAIDGRLPFPPMELPEVLQREGVVRPAKIGALGVEVIVRNFRLWRDVHYTQAGQHGTRSPIRLQAGEYFVLGDNSPNSDDSRFWPSPVVPEPNFIGKPVLLHMPTRVLSRNGGRWRLPDWSRMRVLR